MNFLRTQSGNVFFIILIAVGLFSMLAFVISQSARNENTSALTQREARLAAADIVSYGQSVQRGVDRVRRKGCSENQISFEHDEGLSKKGTDAPYDYENANSPDDYSCHVFHRDGGGVRPRLLSSNYTVNPEDVPSGWMHPDSFIITATRVVGNGTESGTSGTDLLLWVGRLKNDVCMHINIMNGIINPANKPPVDSFDCANQAYDGTFSVCNNPIGNSQTQLQRKKSFCVAYNNSGANNHYMHVLLPR